MCGYNYEYFLSTHFYICSVLQQYCTDDFLVSKDEAEVIESAFDVGRVSGARNIMCRFSVNT